MAFRDGLATTAKFEKMLPAMIEKVTSLGGVGSRRDLEALYGKLMIALAVKNGHFKSVTVIYQGKGQPNRKFSVICTDAWDRKKPYWME